MAAVLEKSAHGRGECFEGRGRSQSGNPGGSPLPLRSLLIAADSRFVKTQIRSRHSSASSPSATLLLIGGHADAPGVRRGATFPCLAVQPPFPPLPGLLRKARLLPAHGFSPAVARTALCAARPPRSSANARFRATCSGPPPCCGTLAPPPAEACPLSWLRLPRHPPPLLPPMLLSSTFSVARKH